MFLVPSLRTLCLTLAPGDYFVLILNFVVSFFTFKFMIYFELVLTLGIILRLRYFFSCELFQHHLLKNLSLLH